MATQKQTDANRRNAQLSTGPRTAEGKRASSQNALLSGLDAESQFVLGESCEEFALLQSEYFRRFAPQTPDERFQVDNLIRNEWILRRLFRVESHLWEFYILQCDRSTGVQLGEAYTRGNTAFLRLQRRIAAVEKAYEVAHAALTALRQQPEPEQLDDSAEQTQNPRPVPTPPLHGGVIDPELLKLDRACREEMLDSASAQRCKGNAGDSPIPLANEYSPASPLLR